MEKTEKKKSGLATAGMVLSIIGVCTSFIPLVNNASFVLGVLALVFGLVSLVKRASLGKAITALILGVLSIVITLTMQAQLSKAIDDAIDGLDTMTGSKTETILADNLDVSFGEFEVEKSEFLDQAKLSLSLKNKGEKQASFSVEIEAVDSNGKRIETDTVFANDLKAGQSQDFEAFTLVNSDDYEALKKAEFKVLEVSMF